MSPDRQESPNMRAGIVAFLRRCFAWHPKTERAEAEYTLAMLEARKAHSRLRDAIDILPEGIVFLDSEGRYILWNQQYSDIYKRSADLFQPGARLVDTLRIGVERGDYPEAAGREQEWMKERLHKLFHPDGRHEQTLSDGRTILIEERRTSDGGIIGLRVDITEMKQREASFRLLFDSNPVPMFVYGLDDLRILAVNDAAVKHYGYPREQVLRMSLLDIHHPDEGVELGHLGGALSEDHAGRTWKHRKADGATIDVAIFLSHLTYEGQRATLIAAIDITERKAAETRVEYMAHHDALTSLPNRILLRLRMEEMISDLRRSGRGFAVFCVDLDNSNGSTIRLAIRSATCCCRELPAGCAPSCATSTPSRGWAATNSPSCRPTSARRRRSATCWRGCWPSSPSRSSWKAITFRSAPASGWRWRRATATIRIGC
jgi:PAS domain S-box-containing protein